MPLSRNHRIDRRRRVMLEAVVHDPELVAEQAKIARRKRLRAIEAENDVEPNYSYRDPGYSQAVRRACQQRVVQLIPVRRGMVAAALTVLWIGFGALVLGHYALHTMPLDPKTWNIGTLAIARLFDLTAWNSICHWLTCQLWLLTAIACWMTFNLRRHKLDDYRARYRIWAVVGFVALFLHFDASTSTLLLIGQTIDPWARKEIGYAGWPLVLATSASLIGVLAIRLCSELKTVPSAVVSWVFGLLAVAVSALMGTGLIKTQMQPDSLRLLTGSLWLGGALAAFQAIAMYLRHTYIAAQKRFLSRSGVDLKPIQLKVPKLGWKRGNRTNDSREADDETTHERKRWRDRLPWIGQRDLSHDEDVLDSEDEELESKSPRSKNRAKDNDSGKNNATKEEPQVKKLFGVIPNRELANQNPEFEPVAEDDGGDIDRGLTKKGGWFGLGGNKSAQPTTPKESKKESVKQLIDHRDNDQKTANESTEEKRRWLWNRKQKAEKVDDRQSNQKVDDPETKTKQPWKKPNLSAAAKMLDPRAALRGWRNKSQNAEGETKETAKPSDKEKKSGFLGLRKKSNEAGEAKEAKPNKVKADKPVKEKRSWFGMFDGLKLKPPTAGENAGEATPQPIKPATTSNVPRPSTESYQDDGSGEKHLSKAERKRLRQQQNERRAA
jgi:hypothetical protein